MSHNVFISHSVKEPDQRAAEAVYDYLRASGITCFMDTRNLVPGATYHTQLATAVKGSKVVVLIFSSNSDDSEAVGNEMAIARNNKISIIPLRIEDTPPRKLEFFISTTQWLDVFRLPLEEQLPRLLEAIRHHLNRQGDNEQASGRVDEGKAAGWKQQQPSQKQAVEPPVAQHDWIQLDSPPDWITQDPKLLSALNSGKVIRGKIYLYRYNSNRRCYEKKQAVVLPTYHPDWTDIDSPPHWIVQDREVLGSLNSGKVVKGKNYLYRYNKDRQRYQKKSR